MKYLGMARFVLALNFKQVFGQDHLKNLWNDILGTQCIFSLIIMLVTKFLMYGLVMS